MWCQVVLRQTQTRVPAHPSSRWFHAPTSVGWIVTVAESCCLNKQPRVSCLTPPAFLDFDNKCLLYFRRIFFFGKDHEKMSEQLLQNIEHETWVWSRILGDVKRRCPRVWRFLYLCWSFVGHPMMSGCPDAYTAWNA